ncbi:hypothetical protein E2C01_028291 [Portunus trituberculatus]|uniref:Uncharacterized protein n=1 Tax=Portunus trituberculatus TaxID=210409 RepID=A0A5B7ENP6_PORTR|nr:hypothetical protein [Portunus trituberculatus]
MDSPEASKGRDKEGQEAQPKHCGVGVFVRASVRDKRLFTRAQVQAPPRLEPAGTPLKLAPLRSPNPCPRRRSRRAKRLNLLAQSNTKQILQIISNFQGVTMLPQPPKDRRSAASVNRGRPAADSSGG